MFVANARTEAFTKCVRGVTVLVDDLELLGDLLPYPIVLDWSSTETVPRMTNDGFGGRYAVSHCPGVSVVHWAV